MKNHKKEENYLDYIPFIREDLKYEEDSDGKITIYRQNTGIISRLATFLYGSPKETRIDLDPYGNFIWHYIDGQNTVYQIGLKVKEEFGQRAEPIFERISQYFNILQTNGFITMK